MYINHNGIESGELITHIDFLAIKDGQCTALLKFKLYAENP